MSDDLRRGWCPGAWRPMMTRDGLLVRLRVTGGILPAGKAEALADLASRHGNGLLDLSARGNLQLRGVTEQSLATLQDALRRLGLIDETAEHEAVRNVVASPLAGLASWLDIRALVGELEQAIVADATCRTLPGKFAILVDDGSQPSLADIEADLRFDWQQETAVFSIGLGGTHTTAIPIGTCRAEDLVGRAVDLSSVAARLLDRHATSRIGRLLTQLGRTATLRTFGLDEQPYMRSLQPMDVSAWIGRHETIRHLPIMGFAAPFGRLDATMLRSTAACAARTAFEEIRLTPWRLLLIPGCEASESLPGFITDANDPRLAVAACVGADGCTRGTTPTHDHASRLAALLSDAAGAVTLHVAGCAKGCAKPSATPLTIVAENGRYGLVRDGRASDRPVAADLSFTEIAALLRECA